MPRLLTALMLCVSILHAVEEPPRPAGHWPQWRGPGRLNVSPDKNLLTEWSKGGPPLAWRVDGIGEGVAGVAVAGGRAYVMGHRGALEHLTCVNEATGRPLWSVPLGPAAKEMVNMRYLSQRTPLIDGDFAYALTATGHLACVRADSGRRVWSKDYARDLGGRRGGFGWCDQLLKDGDKLICVPGGKTAVVALNAATGDPVWKCPIDQTAAYVGAVLVEGKGVRKHYVAVTSGGLHGVSTDGKLLWESSRFARNTANSCTPNVLGRHLFTAGNYGRGVGLYELSDTADGVEAKEVHATAMSTPSWHEMVVLQGDHAYVGLNAGLRCLEWKTGKVIWDEPRKAEHRPPYSGTCADGRLYVRTQQGDVLLVRASPEKFVVDGTFRLPDAKPLPGSVAPVVTGGRLFLRHEQTLFCYDVQKGAKVGKPAVHAAPEPAKKMEPPLKVEGKREPDTIFAPTPQPVVEAMLEAAKVKKTDVVVDLGCGDGRIVVTAARKYGCKALGYDLDPECVRMAKESVAKHKVPELVTIEQKDLFTAALDRVDVVALYLPPKMTERLVPRLEKLPAGARVVAHAFAIPGLVPEREFKVTTADGLEHKVFVYATPLRKAR